jgi:hypothetical protein
VPDTRTQTRSYPKKNNNTATGGQLADYNNEKKKILKQDKKVGATR